MKPLLLLPALIGLAFLPLPSPQQKPTHKPAASESATPATIQVSPPRPEVKQIYKVDCAICHGASGDGQGDIGKSMSLLDWTNPTSLTSKTDQQLFDMIRKGNDKMPPEDSSRAKDDEVKGLVKYIRTFSKGQPATPAAQPAAEPAAEPAPAPAPATTPTSPTSN